ncbi:MAG: sodium/glutamate symporter [Phycisphaerae bacterium]|jgi:ESS family glutamate:Na+ symporter|nr:sodium/glutamate symporter [Phycisphaerae bacterium]MDP7286406.1 sodium/glutamate symporter [Phycisphaerae bacterium]
MSTSEIAVVSFISLCVLVWVGHLIRMKIRLMGKLYLPSSVIAGLIGLAIVQCCRAYGTPLPEGVTTVWGKLPGFLINIVFACLFLGMAIPGIKTIWRHAGPQLAYGQIVAWGQYVVGIGLFLAIITWMYPELPAMFGGVLPVGFEGGHGTAGGMTSVFAEYNWEAGKDFALACATAGIMGAVIVGMMLVNWAARKGYTTRKQNPEDVPEDDSIAVIPIEKRPEAGKLTISSNALETLSFQLAMVGIAIAIGWAGKQGLLAAGRASGNDTLMQLAKSFPLFPLCMLGGLVVQVIDNKFDKYKLIDLGLMKRIQNAALDFLVIAAIATIRIEAIADGLVPFAILVVGGIAWNIFCVMYLARRLLPDAWFERSIAEMGQSMGVTATGLLLLRVVDPDYESPAADAFAYKQILHEPFMGGGLWTSAAIPLLAIWGGWPVLAIAAGAVVVWLVTASFMRARN